MARWPRVASVPARALRLLRALNGQHPEMLVLAACPGKAWTALEAEPRPEREALWAGAAPTGTAALTSADAFITIHRPARPNGVAVVICPGGGYQMLCVEPEGTGIATWLTTLGITGIVLEYRLPNRRHALPLLDAQRAIRVIRARAAVLGLDPARIGIMGFSAGGHLAATAATRHDAGDATAADPIARVSCRPDFAILIYPVITMGQDGHAGSREQLLGPRPTPELIRRYSTELHVTATTPPIYLAHARDDDVVPIANSRGFAAACTAAGVPVRLLELPSGGHGLNGYQGTMWEAWKEGVVAWDASGG